MFSKVIKHVIHLGNFLYFCLNSVFFTMQQNETESGYLGGAPLTSMKAICSQSTLYMSW